MQEGNINVEFFICKDIIQLINEKQHEIVDMISNAEKQSSKALFVYSYAIFESTITEILRYYLYAFPEKIDKRCFEIEKDELIATPITYDILQGIVDRYIRKYSSESLLKYLNFFERTISVKLEINEHNIEKISEMRNHIIHDDLKYSLLCRHMHSKEVLLNYQDMVDCMSVLLKLLEKISGEIGDVYRDYTKERLVRNLWKYVFFTSLLNFDKIWTADKNGELRLGDIELIKEMSTLICRSEQLFLAVFLQQYNSSINGEISPYEKIPPLVGLDSESKRKLVKIVTFFSYFPLFFCGEKIRE